MNSSVKAMNNGEDLPKFPNGEGPVEPPDEDEDEPEDEDAPEDEDEDGDSDTETEEDEDEDPDEGDGQVAKKSKKGKTRTEAKVEDKTKKAKAKSGTGTEKKGRRSNVEALIRTLVCEDATRTEADVKKLLAKESITCKEITLHYNYNRAKRVIDELEKLGKLKKVKT